MALPFTIGVLCCFLAAQGAQTQAEELWDRETKDVSCSDRHEFDVSDSQSECQEMCLSYDNCAGISYTHKFDSDEYISLHLHSWCMLCRTDELHPADNDYGFYRNPSYVKACKLNQGQTYGQDKGDCEEGKVCQSTGECTGPVWDNVRCPIWPFQRLEYGTNPDHGDICRHSDWPENKKWRCPKTCTKVKGWAAEPFCMNQWGNLVVCKTQ